MSTRSLEQKSWAFCSSGRGKDRQILRKVKKSKLLHTLYKSPRDADELGVTFCLLPCKADRLSLHTPGVAVETFGLDPQR